METLNFADKYIGMIKPPNQNKAQRLIQA